MVLKRLPTLDGSDRLPTQFLPGAVTASGDTTGVEDTTAIQALEDAGASPVTFGAGTFYTTGLVKKAETIWQGAGRFNTVIKLADGADAAAVVVGDGFDTLTGTGDVTDASIGGWGIRDLSIDGNKAGQAAAPDGVRVYGYNFDLTNVSIYNVATGLYTEWGDFGGEDLPDLTMEAQYSGLKIHNFDGHGWHNRGPHDSRAYDVTIYNSDTGTGFGYWGESNKTTTVAAGSNGVDLDTFAGAGTLNVATTLGYRDTGTLSVVTGTGDRTVTYTGRTATSFTGCTSPAPAGSTVATGAAVVSTGLYSADGMQITNMHVWGSPLWCYVLDTQTHLIDCVGEVSSPGGGQVLVRGAQSQIVGGMYIIYSGFTANGCGVQVGDAANPVFGLRMDTALSGFTGADAAHAALNIVNDGGSNSVDATVYQPSGTALFGTPNVGYSRYRVVSGGGTRAQNASRSYDYVMGQHIGDLPDAGQAWLLGSDGTDFINLNTSNNRLEFLALLTRWYADEFYSSPSVEIDGPLGHLNFRGSTAPSAAIVTAAIGTGGNGAATVLSGNDHRGTIAVTAASTGIGSFPATVANMTFVNAFANNPQVMVTPINAASAALGVFAQAFSTSQFLLGFRTAPTASTTYTFAYVVLG